MHITELTAYAVRVPLKREVKHASASRRESVNVLVGCRLADGTQGWGEGVPRTYVTGESVEGALQQFGDTPLAEPLARDCGSWDDVIAVCGDLSLAESERDPRGCYGNALRCAIELSVLDAFGRLFGEPVSSVVGAFQPAAEVRAQRDRVRYSAAITAEGSASERASALKMRVYGFASCKVKVAVKGADDVQRMRRIRRWIGNRVDLRLDANESWAVEEVAMRMESLVPFGVSCIEQPVPHQQVAALAGLRLRLGVPVMLDESLTGIVDARHAIQHQTCDLFNIRLSKCGGFLNSLRLAALAHEAGLGYQLGCHPGETGVLSAAGRHWAAAVRNIRYVEGSYDRHLLAELITNEDITFRYGGWAPALRGPGLGVTVNQRLLEHYMVDRRTQKI